MRSSLHGTFATLLLLVPVSAIPALAIFGIPQFAPVVASPRHEGHEGDRERREGRSARGPADELFLEEDGLASRDDEADLGRGDAAAPGRLGDAVAVPVQHAARNTSPEFNDANSRDARQRDAREQPSNSPGRLPSWADDLPVENRPAAAAPPPRGNSKFERSADARAVPPQHAPEIRPFTRSAADRGDTNPTRRATPGTHDGGAIRLAGNEAFVAAAPQGFQRQRELPLDRAASVPAPHDAAASMGLTWPTAVRQLNDLEIRNFRLEPGRQPGQFVFICSYTPTDSPRVSYRFEAEANEPLKAVEKVLAQIGEWQQRR